MNYYCASMNLNTSSSEATRLLTGMVNFYEIFTLGLARSKNVLPVLPVPACGVTFK